MPRAEPKSYVTDFTHFEGVLDPTSNAPAAAKKIANFFDELVRVASRESAGTMQTDVHCFEKPARRGCSGKIVTTRTRDRDEISWRCPSCGNNGEVHHWRGAKADMSPDSRPETGHEMRSAIANSFAGTWRITNMELWDQAAIDLLGPGFVRFDDEQNGEFQFIAVRGWLDCRYGARDGQPLVEFSWEGDDEGTEACGRGWAVLENNGKLTGRIYFHSGDDSDFTAVK